MGLFSFFKHKTINFQPNLKKSEYENWLDFIDCGGSTEQWERLKAENGWNFPESEVERWEKYQKEVKKISDRYYKRMQKIQHDWSVMYNLGEYDGIIAANLEKECLANIADYQEMRRIDRKYGQKTPNKIPAFLRLAMLYEKQSRFEEAIKICKQACSNGMDERSRMVRMIKKAGRTATEDELELLDEE